MKFKAVQRFCEYHHRGLECGRASIANPHRCGCSSLQKSWEVWPYGRSRSHIRNITKQMRLLEK